MSESQEQFPYFLPSEVAVHNKPEDCWLSCLGGVYDLTEYVTRNSESRISTYLMGHGGRDVSHWFDAPREGQRQRHSSRKKRTARLRRYVDPATGVRRILLPYCSPMPEGVYSTFVPVFTGDCPCSCCCAEAGSPGCSGDRSPKRDDVNYSPDGELTGKCWSELECIFNSRVYQRGWLTKKGRSCRITNVLTGHRAIISVCEEDSIRRIQERALIFNRHGASYTWKFEGKLLDASLSLTENGIVDERDRYLACGLPDDSTTYIPNLLCYYNDDLTEL